MTKNETDLVKTTYLDALAVLQQEKDLENREFKKKMLAERKSQNEIRKKGIDKKIVNLYLKEKFPDAFRELGINGMSEKEFPSILKRAKRYFRMWFAGKTAISSTIIGGEIFLLLNFIQDGFLIAITVIFVILTSVVCGLFIADSGKILMTGEELELPPDKNNHTTSLGG